ncbi:hypothetical protein CVV65_07415 [Kyrpidia spormannii]|uniref:Uncharacterized protein n=1 Tax=Kyrpidia spormannii TaxID=2055160 RepID=A0A2K8N620_9BACL|nr:MULTISPECIES: hypothetical protein [Kyrpidia]ATY84776.1 hypothetical protein CVV65_07415 [Kyrpidia spormannii]MCL6575536.1 hypothetical protein [Kyrpidia sp.]CAB3392841.1 conserved protein of unknown function [Kyrpidia spormannii]HHY66769.1 hypothetical protein [Alicyclobacillus sp.]
MYVMITQGSRKARAAKDLYETLKSRTSRLLPPIREGEIEGWAGVEVPEHERGRVLAMRFHDEHLSPYIKSDMNLFHLLMLDEHVEMRIYRAERGWLFVFEGVQAAPKPFGAAGFDPR